MLVYANLTLIPGRLSVYVDQQIAPGGSLNREAYVRFNFAGGRAHLKGGQFFLPYGWRLEDDTAFIRQVPGINYTTPDEGVEFGWEEGSWSAQIAITNGTAGGGDVDTTKQVSLLGSYTTSTWRLGASFNFNDADAGDRRMQNLYGGIRTGPVSWLGEVDYIVDDGTSTGRRDMWAGLAEANVRLRQGHNVKFSYEYFEPDDDVAEDERNRLSLLYEYFPFQFTQLRLGVRAYDGIPQNDQQNRTDYFLELHGYF